MFGALSTPDLQIVWKKLSQEHKNECGRIAQQCLMEPILQKLQQRKQLRQCGLNRIHLNDECILLFPITPSLQKELGGEEDASILLVELTCELLCQKGWVRFNPLDKTYWAV